MVRPIILAGCSSTTLDLISWLIPQPDFLVRVLSPLEPLASLVSQQQPDLILLDSVELSRQLKLHRQTASTPLLLLACPLPQQGLFIEPEITLCPPFSPQEFRHALDSVLLIHQQRLREGIRAELTCCVPSDPGELDALHLLLTSWLNGCGLTGFQIRQLLHAVREVVANAIEWGHRYDRSRLVRVECRLDREKVAILVRDSGPGFDRHNLPHAARPGDPLSHLPIREALHLREGGFGILLASGLVDHLCYSTTGNEGLLIKYLPSASYDLTDPDPLDDLFSAILTP